ncbi:hypothetical protein VTK26DRAFT_2154 [Humicola hyalothermophila]
MAPSIARLGAAALAYASGIAALEAYELKESYTPSNFFDKFTFFSQGDPNHGFVQYRNKETAFSMGLARKGEDDVYIGVDSTEKDPNGRSSVRLESLNRYNSGLFIADFTHFPGKACGTWPAFWMVGPEWPDDGEVDIYEGWNLEERNKVVLHTDHPDRAGVCRLEEKGITGDVMYSNCWTADPKQPPNAGCAVEETNGLWANPDGGVYATEWQEDRIKVWSWPQDSVPADVKSKKPNPANWGPPSLAATSKTCDVKKSFNNMRLVLNINLCGDAAGNIWDKCKAQTRSNSCADYVQHNPSAFKESYWKVRGIDVYQLETVEQPTTSVGTTSAAPTSTEASEPVVTETTSAASETEDPATEPTATASETEDLSTITPSASATPTESEDPTETETECEDEDETAAPTGEPTITSEPTATETEEPSETETECPDEEEPTVTASPSVTATETEEPSETETECVPDDEDDETSTGTVEPTITSKPTATETEGPVETETECIPDDDNETAAPTGEPTITSEPTATKTEDPTETETDSECPPDDEETTTGGVEPTITDSATITATETEDPIATETESECPPDDEETTTGTAGPTVTDDEPKPTPTSSVPDGWSISTIYTTTTYTITSCPETVTKCPAQVTTSLVPIGTTLCPANPGDDDAPATTIRTVSKTASAAVPEPTDADDGDDEGGSDSEGGDDSSPLPTSTVGEEPGPETSGVVAPPAPTPTVPPVEIVTTAEPVTAAPTSTGPVLVNAGAKAVGGGVAMGLVGAVMALVM